MINTVIFYFFLPNTIHWSKLNLSQEMEQLTIIRNRNSANTFSLSNNLQRCKYILYFPASTQSQSQFLQESPDPVNYQEGSLPNCLKGKIVWVSSMEKACFPGGACNKKPFYAQCVKAYNLLLVTIFYLSLQNKISTSCFSSWYPLHLFSKVLTLKLYI